MKIIDYRGRKYRVALNGQIQQQAVVLGFPRGWTNVPATHRKTIAFVREAVAKAKRIAVHTSYFNRARELGIVLTAYKCPSCNSAVATQAAPDGETWDTLSECPYCAELHMKITTGDNARAIKLDTGG